MGEELGVCGSLRIMFHAIRRWSSLGTYGSGAWPGNRMNDGLEAWLSTYVMLRSAYISDC
jgi:hypothetical protein